MPNWDSSKDTSCLLYTSVKGLNNGADAYMEKPFSIELLVAQVANLLKSREVLTRTYKETPSTPATSCLLYTSRCV